MEKASQIIEHKRKCNQCGKIWHSLADREEKLEKQIKTDTVAKGLSTCTCSLPGYMLANQKQHSIQSNQNVLENLRRCPECGSTDFTEKKMVHEKKE